MAQTMPPITMVDVGAVKLAVRLWGSGPALMLVHGLGTCSELWVNQVEPLGRDYRMIAVDLRGFGQSERPRAANSYSIDLFAADLVALAARLGIDRLNYLGTSMGGFIGQTLALHNPGLISSLLLVHTAARMTMPAEIVAARVAALRHQPMEEYACMVATQALAAGPQSPIFDWLVAMVARNDRDAYVKVLTEALGNFDQSDSVASLRFPTLVVVGDTDRVIPMKGGLELASLIPGAQTMVLKAAGHIGYAEQPEAFNKAVLSFLSRSAN
jgi:pimeloyl-ACP methyl ester carboxylesterase